MKDEIKEIINQLEIAARKHTIEVCEDGSKIETMSASVVDELRLNNYSAKLLYDYITNLQEELQKANDTLDTHNELIDSLTKEKQEYKDMFNLMVKFRDKALTREWDYKSRNEKAIEILKLCNSKCSKEVINILNGDNEE